MADDEAVRRWTICGQCHDLKGGPIGVVDGVTVWQLWDCLGKAERAAQPVIGDFNTAFELCQACGLELLRSGSRWSTWFCKPCTQRAKALNEQSGGCVFPVGRHSMMSGVATRATSEEALDALADALWSILQMTRWLKDWARTVVVRNLESAGLPLDTDVDVMTYLAAVRGAARSDDRFNEMVLSRLETA